MFLKYVRSVSFQCRKLQYSYYKAIANTIINTIVGKGFLQPLFYEDLPLHFLPPLFRFFPPHPHPPSSSPPTSTSTALFVVLFCQHKGDHAIFDVLICLMILWIYTYEALEPSTRKTLLCIFCNKASSLLRSDTMAFCWYSDLLSHTHKRKYGHIDTQHTQRLID